MKKILTLLTTIFILFNLTGCTTNKTPNSNIPNNNFQNETNNSNNNENNNDIYQEEQNSNNSNEPSDEQDSNNTITNNNQKPNETNIPSESYKPNKTPSQSTQQPENNENKTTDITPPLITSITIKEQGQTLKSGDLLTLNVSITEESDISTCQIAFINTTTGAKINAHGSFKHRDDGKYSYTYKINDDMSSGKWILSSTFIGDKYDMYGDDTITNKSNIFFYVENSSSDITPPLITSITIKEQGQTLKSGDLLTLNVSITEESDISTCQIAFTNTTTGAKINTHGSFKHRDDGKYSYTYKINDDMSSGKWILSSTFIGDKYDMYGDDTITNKSNIFFYVENSSSDITPPLITSITIKEQGQTLKSGDLLTLNVSITEESDISTCQIVFTNTTTGAKINAHGSFKHRDDGKYSYTYKINDDMSSGKWILSSTFIGDKYDMYGDDTITNKSNIFFYVQ